MKVYVCTNYVTYSRGLIGIGIIYKIKRGVPMHHHLAGRAGQRREGAVRRRHGELSLQIPEPPQRPPQRELQTQHQAVSLRVAAEGRGHAVHTLVARNRQREQVQRAWAL